MAKGETTDGMCLCTSPATSIHHKQEAGLILSVVIIAITSE